MKIEYQGRIEETAAATVAEFLAAKGVQLIAAVVEYRGEAYPPGADLRKLQLVQGAELNVFQMVAGG